MEFETFHVMLAILGGLGNVDQCRTVGEPFFEGVSLRLFDVADDLWRIYWIDTTGARLFPPITAPSMAPSGPFAARIVTKGGRSWSRSNGTARIPTGRTGIRHFRPTAVRPGKSTGICPFAVQMPCSRC
jgi:hypothetical protein